MDFAVAYDRFLDFAEGGPIAAFGRDDRCWKTISGSMASPARGRCRLF